MYSSIANTTFAYLLTMEDFRNSMGSDVKPSWIKITTITMVAKFDTTVDVLKIKEMIPHGGGIELKWGNTIQYWKIKDTKFYNQITLCYNDSVSKKSIKLFPNGSVQVAGCHDLFDCKNIITKITAALTTITDTVLPSDNDFRVVMINTNFSTNYQLNLFELMTYFSTIPMFNVSFDPDRYSAVKVKFKPAADMKCVTVSMFCTGRVIITGAETLKEIAYTYNIINKFINTNPLIKVKPTKTVDVFDTIHGYDINELLKYLKTKGFKPWGFVDNNYKINF